LLIIYIVEKSSLRSYSRHYIELRLIEVFQIVYTFSEMISNSQKNKIIEKRDINVTHVK